MQLLMVPSPSVPFSYTILWQDRQVCHSHLHRVSLSGLHARLSAEFPAADHHIAGCLHACNINESRCIHQLLNMNQQDYANALQAAAAVS